MPANDQILKIASDAVMFSLLDHMFGGD